MSTDSSPTVSRAVVVVAEQLGCDEDTALEALRAVAVAAEESLQVVALRVPDGTVRFDA